MDTVQEALTNHAPNPNATGGITRRLIDLCKNFSAIERERSSNMHIACGLPAAIYLATNQPVRDITLVVPGTNEPTTAREWSELIDDELDQPQLLLARRIEQLGAVDNTGATDKLINEFTERFLERIENALGEDHWLVMHNHLDGLFFDLAWYPFSALVYADIHGREDLFRAFLPLVELLPKIVLLGHRKDDPVHWVALVIP
jgi:hypothetical protein